MRTMLSTQFKSVTLLATIFSFLAVSTGCDTYQDVIVEGNDIIVRNFSFSGSDLFVSEDGTIGTYQREIPELTSDIVEDGAVLLYASGELLFGSGAAGSWAALPVTVSVDEDGDEYVDYALTYSYSYDIQDLYVDLIASSPLDYTHLAGTDMKLVLIPGNLFVGNARAGIDYSDYESVRQAYGIAE